DDSVSENSDGSDDSGSDDSAGSATVRGSDSSDEITAIADAASEVAEGDAVDIDAKRDGSWEVTLETADGDESEVRVASDGTARVIETEDAGSDDRGPEHVLDADTIDALVKAALSDTPGTVLELDSGDGSTPYDVTVLSADGTTVDLELDQEFTIAARDTDD
ncbi:PepSY domain-containing protein, partial [Microbacterium sp.]|uniref:PepSY domain-containing protein n=1 Tax=Microbacterium sp. TaxID=51671 RepID=UPI0035C7E555